MGFRLAGLVALALLGAMSPALQQERPLRPERDRIERLQDRRQDQRSAQREDRSESAPPAQSDPLGVLRLLPPDAVSEKQILVAGRPLAYTATAGTLSLYNLNGDRTAAVFYTAYVAKAVPAARRPITFVFNGGPGAASAYLHLGLAGPRLVDFGPEGRDGAAASLRDNPETWLAFTDLVMIDPVGTGWSRPTRPENFKLFNSVRGDAESIAKVISLYIGQNSRTASPKYLLGESYGGFRAAKVARVLQNDHGIIVSGIVMVSPMIETSLQWGRSERDPLKAALVFPSIVATELERTKKFSPETLAEAERFALMEYLPTLAGTPPAGQDAQQFYEKIARMTGLSVSTVAQTGGYVRAAYSEQLRKQGFQTSSYDLSFWVYDIYRNSPYRQQGDPILDGFLKALSGVFVGYARDELGFKTEITYTLLNRESNWDWGGRGERPGVSDDLRAMLALNPSFRLLVAHGRSDLVTPYGVSRYLLDHIRPPAAPGRVQLKTYGGGHMFYFNDAERRAFTADAKMFYQGGQ